MSVVVPVAHGHGHEPAPTNTGLTNGLIGVMCFLTSEMALFGSLIFAYLYLRRADTNPAHAPFETVWPPYIPGTHIQYETLPLVLAAVNTVVLLSSGVTMHFAFQSLRRGNVPRMLTLLVITIILGVGFLSGQAWEYAHVNKVAINTNIYGGAFFTLTGLHGLHVTGGVIFLLIILWRTLSGRITPDRPIVAQAATLYWHFVDAVWVVLFALFYLTVPA